LRPKTSRRDGAIKGTSFPQYVNRAKLRQDQAAQGFEALFRENLMTRRTRSLLVTCACLIAAIVAGIWAYTLMGWLGVGILGTLVTFCAVRVELEQDGPTPGGQYHALHAENFRRRDEMGRAEKAALQAETYATMRIARLVKFIGLALLVIGACGFFLYQMYR
jgi:hypothetical protein